MSKTNHIVLRLLQIAVIAVFFGRAYQHWFWDAPYRTLLWDENLMSGIIEGLFNLSWDDYITNNEVDERIQNWIKGIGVFYFICGWSVLFLERFPKWVSRLLWLGSLSLVFLAVLYCKEKFYSLGQFFEYALQFGSPVVLLFYFHKSIRIQNWLLLLRILIALTFTCHGLYAYGYYPVPGNFVEMTISILNCSDEQALQFLKLAGILDFILSVLLFFPFKTARWALWYAIFWGFSTTIARIWANFYWEFPWESLHQWMFEMVYRFPHFILPVSCYLVWRNFRKKTAL